MYCRWEGGYKYGVATGFAAAVGTVGHSLLLIGGTTLVVGISVKYIWDADVECFEEKRD